MDYHLGRDGTPLGTFPEDEIRSGLQSGRFLPDDLAWCEGMSDWKPLSVVLPSNAPGPLSLVKETPASDSDVALRPASGLPPDVPSTWLPPSAANPAHIGVGVMPTSGTAIASLVLGILSLVTCYFGLLFVIPGLICGHIAMNQIKAPGSRYQGRGLALAGLIMNYIWIGLCILVVIAMILFAALGSVVGNQH